MFGLLTEDVSVAASLKTARISSFTSGVAVAVRAITGIPGRWSCSPLSILYFGLDY